MHALTLGLQFLFFFVCFAINLLGLAPIASGGIQICFSFPFFPPPPSGHKVEHGHDPKKHLSLSLSLQNFLRQCCFFVAFSCSGDSGSRSKSLLQSVYQKSQFESARYLRLVFFNLKIGLLEDVLEMWIKFGFNQLEFAETSLECFIFLALLFKNCLNTLQPLSIQIDAQSVSLHRFDHSNETVLVRKIAIRFRCRRMTKHN